MRLEVVQARPFADEWCVTVDGTYVVGFAGPNARDRAEQHRDELSTLLGVVSASFPGAPQSGRDPSRPGSSDR